VGTHLILQVSSGRKPIAAGDRPDGGVALTTEFAFPRNIRYDEVRRVDDTHIVVRNIPSDQVAQFP